MIEWLTDQNNIAFLIALAGFAISIYNFVSGIIQNHTRIKVEVAHVFRSENQTRCIDTLNLKLLNLSKNPVVVSRITIKNELRTGSIGTYRREVAKVTHYTGSSVTGRNVWISDNLPVKIEGNGCVNLLLVSDSETPLFEIGIKNTLKIYTAKKMVRYSFLHNEFSAQTLLEKSREPST